MRTKPSLAAKASESTTRSPERVKVSFNLSEDELEDLRALANRRSDTVTDTLRRAIALGMLADEAHREGSKMILMDSDGTMREIVLK